jgi:pheromone shutdown-related protein TraB
MSIERIRIGSKEIILVGTAHISAESVRLAQETISAEKPDLVGIELDDQRFHQLQNDAKWQTMNIGAVIADNKTYLLLLNIFLSNLQRRLGEQVAMKPGQEMISAAYTAAQNSIPIALLDRNIQITMQRAFALTPLVEKIRILLYLIGGMFGEGERITPEKIEELKRQDIVTQLIGELAKTAPTVKKVLVDERDAYIANRILAAPANRMVCVIGAGHLEGIKRILEKRQPVDERELLTVPAKKSVLRHLQWIIPIAFVAVLIALFLNKGIEQSATALLYWIAITGTTSAIGAALARSHPFTIATAFIAAPLTTLHPFLASGWFAAGIEAKYRAPLVTDFQSLNTLNSLSDFQRNRVTHLLIVASLTNIGSMIGVVIALPYLATLL